MDEKRERVPQAGEQPSDTERLVGDTAASEPLTTGKRVQPSERESRDAANAVDTPRDQDRDD